jgi:hypothetical protein
MDRDEVVSATTWDLATALALATTKKALVGTTDLCPRLKSEQPTYTVLAAASSTS